MIKLTLAVAAAAACFASQVVVHTPPQTGRPLPVADAIEAYARGEVTAASQIVLDRQTSVTLTRALESWTDAGSSADTARRRLIANAFALEACWFASRTLLNALQTIYDPGNNVTPRAEEFPVTSYIAQGVIAEWVMRRLPAQSAPTTLERLQVLAAVGLAEDGHAWHRLKDEIVPRAQRLLPNEPRVRLADVLARTNANLGPLRRQRLTNPVLKDESVGSAATRHIQSSIALFESLVTDAALTGEAHLRIGYLELRRSRWNEAVASLDRARTHAAEPVLRAAADYFAGFALEQLDRPGDAIAAYRRAITETPDVRTVAVRLSALLYLDNRRDEAYRLLDRGLNARPVPTDLLVVVERADARFMPEWLAAMRDALR